MISYEHGHHASKSNRSNIKTDALVGRTVIAAKVASEGGDPQERFSSSGGRKEAMAENTEETAAMVKEGLGTAYAKEKRSQRW